MADAAIALTLSFGFLWNVKKLVLAAIGDFKPDDVLVQILTQGHNWYTPHGLAAYILATTSVEAFVNEQFFGLATLLGPQYPVIDLGLDEDLEKLNLLTKVRLLPLLASMKPLTPGTAPHQDLAMLLRIRNDLVHYKMGLRIPPYMSDLQQRGIALRHQTAMFSWTDAISTIEGIRWAHNTACAVIRTLLAEMPRQIPRVPEAKAADDRFTSPIPEGWITEQLRVRRGIDLNALPQGGRS